jgi:hypothetical protein
MLLLRTNAEVRREVRCGANSKYLREECFSTQDTSSVELNPSIGNIAMSMKEDEEGRTASLSDKPSSWRICWNIEHGDR